MFWSITECFLINWYDFEGVVYMMCLSLILSDMIYMMCFILNRYKSGAVINYCRIIVLKPCGTEENVVLFPQKKKMLYCKYDDS
jgi:hypothetical protein